MTNEEKRIVAEQARKYPTGCGYSYFASQKINNTYGAILSIKQAANRAAVIADGWPAVALAEFRHCTESSIGLFTAVIDIADQLGVKIHTYYEMLQYDPKLVAQTLEAQMEEWHCLPMKKNVLLLTKLAVIRLLKAICFFTIRAACTVA